MSLNLTEEQRRRIVKGIDRNLNHGLGVPWRSLADTFGISLKAIVQPGKEGQFIPPAPVVKLPKNLEVYPIEKQTLRMEYEVQDNIGLNYGTTSFLIFNTTLDHETEHFMQLMTSKRALEFFQSVEMRNILVRIVKYGSSDCRNALVEKRPFYQSLYPDPWLLECSPLVVQYAQLSAPEYHKFFENSFLADIGARYPDVASVLNKIARPSLGEILLEAATNSPLHNKAWLFLQEALKYVRKEKFGPGYWNELDRIVAVDNIISVLLSSSLKMGGSQELLKILRNLPYGFVSYEGFDEPKLEDYLGLISHRELRNQLLEYLDNFKKSLEDFKMYQGPIERIEIMRRMIMRLLSQSGQNLDPFIFFIHELGKGDNTSYIVRAPNPGAMEDCIKVLIGGFIDTFICDCVVQGREPRCPFSLSQQNIFGCLDCSGLIEGKGLNNNCPHAKRWLEL